MRVVALLMAGGRGNRMGQDLPKQFLSIDDKPVIAYTMQAFQKNPRIDDIVMVCIKGWSEMLKAYANQFGIAKLRGICEGGSSNFDSIRRGCLLARKLFDDDPLILVHDGVRPNIPQNVIDDCIDTAVEKGNAIAAIPTAEVLLSSTDATESKKVIDRSTTWRTQTPQAFRLSDILELQEKSEEQHLDPKAPCQMAVDLGKEVFFSKGSEKNLKLTTPEDIDIFRSLLHTSRIAWIKQ